MIAVVQHGQNWQVWFDTGGFKDICLAEEPDRATALTNAIAELEAAITEIKKEQT